MSERLRVRRRTPAEVRAFYEGMRYAARHGLSEAVADEAYELYREVARPDGKLADGLEDRPDPSIYQARGGSVPCSENDTPEPSEEPTASPETQSPQEDAPESKQASADRPELDDDVEPVLAKAERWLERQGNQVSSPWVEARDLVEQLCDSLQAAKAEVKARERERDAAYRDRDFRLQAAEERVEELEGEVDLSHGRIDNFHVHLRHERQRRQEAERERDELQDHLAMQHGDSRDYWQSEALDRELERNECRERLREARDLFREVLDGVTWAPTNYLPQRIRTYLDAGSDDDAS